MKTTLSFSADQEKSDLEQLRRNRVKARREKRAAAILYGSADPCEPSDKSDTSFVYIPDSPLIA